MEMMECIMIMDDVAKGQRDAECLRSLNSPSHLFFCP